ncbi:MAG: tRNA pseudouridine(54/55) synthase Pus10 [Candidatus Hermodarchaeota archaeon]
MIFDKILQIYQKYYICVHCLGRMFSLLASHTTNQKRGESLLLSLTMENHQKYFSSNIQEQKASIVNLKLLAEKARFLPAQSVLKNEGIKFEITSNGLPCYLCNNIFLDIEKFGEKGIAFIKGIEFSNFLIGSTPDSQIINREDKFKTEFTLLEAESFKSHFNRVVGKYLSDYLNKSPEFINPELLLIYFIGYNSLNIKLNLKSLFIYGRYNKLIRGIPQTHWSCKMCMGRGCQLCNFTGKQYLTSVEELINPEFIKTSEATDSKFHGAGREDIDVRMLGQGRPFILELRNPKIRKLDLLKMERNTNQKNRKKVKIQNLRYSSKREVIKLKTEAKNTKKIYRSLVESVIKISKEDFKIKLNKLKTIFENQEIHQRTPNRVSHRRTDKIRGKFVYKIDGKFVKPNLFEFTIQTQGGTYIKELISGDNGRTSPSFSEVFNFPLVCKELDVLEISI